MVAGGGWVVVDGACAVDWRVGAGVDEVGVEASGGALLVDAAFGSD